MSKTVITGGAGFIGFHLTHRLLSEGHEVVVFDNLSRRGSKGRLAELLRRHGTSRLLPQIADLRDFGALRDAVAGAGRVYHLAGQVAVTESVRNPLLDFECNAAGTLNLLEAVRQSGADPLVIYSSTNKVYGSLAREPIVEDVTRYRFKDLPYGIPESYPLDFHSPYGCSKGSGDQYVRDYHRIFGLKTIVFRQSCIYGSWQSGAEDQGWLAWFAMASLNSSPLTICGDGKQVRDVLFIDDLLDAFEAAIRKGKGIAGEIFNVGGGPDQSTSVWMELREHLGRLVEHLPTVGYGPWRPGDQRVYISDIRKAGRVLGWSPKTSVAEGLARLVTWLRASGIEWLAR